MSSLHDTSNDSTITLANAKNRALVDEWINAAGYS